MKHLIEALSEELKEAWIKCQLPMKEYDNFLADIQGTLKFGI